MREQINTSSSIERSVRFAQGILVGIIVLMVSLLLLAVWIHARSDEEEAFARAEARLATLSQLLAEHLNRTLSEANTLLATLVSTYAQMGELQSISRLATGALPADSPFAFVGVVDRNGQLQFSTLPVERPLNLSANENVRFHRENASTALYISRPRRGAATSKLTIYLSRRLHDPNDKHAGNVTVGVDPHYFARLVGSLNLDKNLLVSVVGRDGIVRFGGEQQASRIGMDLGETEYFSRNLRSGSHGFFRDDHPFDGVRRVHAFRALDHYPLIVILGQPEEAVLAGLKEHNRSWSMKAGAAALCIVLLGGFAIRQVGLAGRAQSLAHSLGVELEAIMNAQPNCVKVTSDAGRILYMNSQGRELLGCPVDDAVIGHNAEEFVLQKFWPSMRDAMAQAAAGKIALTTFQIRTMTGEHRWIESKMSGLPSHFGEKRIVSVCNDVTERILAENVLRRSEARLREAQRVAQIGDWQLVIETGVLTWSEEVYRIFEVSKSAFHTSYEAFLELVHPEDRRSVEEAYRSSLQSKQPYQLRHRLLLNGGKVKYVEERGVTEYGEDGAAIRSLGTVQDVTTYERMQAEINAERQLTSAIIEHAGILVFVMDADGCIRRANHAFEAMLGYPASVLQGSRPLEEERSPSVHRCRDRAAFGQVVSAPLGSILHYANKVRGKDGAERLIEWTTTTFLCDDGEERHIVGVGVDVTERAATEQRLRAINEGLEDRVSKRTTELVEERNLIASILDVVGALVVVMDDRGVLERVNREMREVTGYEAGELVGRTWQSLLPPSLRARSEGVIERLCSTQGRALEEFELITRVGELRTVAWTFTRVNGSSPDGAHVIGTGVDVTLQRRAEAALQASEQMFRELAENIRETFFVRDVETRTIIYLSPSYEAAWGVSAEDALVDAVACGRSVHPADRKRVTSAMMESVATGRHELTMEYRITDVQGRTRWLYGRSFPIRDVSGRVVRLAGFVEDVTQRRQEENERIARLEAQREVLVREVHHRIKNNLQGVAGLLQQHGDVHPELKTILGEAIGQVRAMAIIHGLQGKDHAERINLPEMVMVIVESVMGVSGKPFDLVVDEVMPKRFIALQSETVPLALIINEVMTNAVKHGSTEHSPIKVRIEAKDGGVLVSVENDKAEWGRALVDWDAGVGLGTGLDLVRALVPRNGVRLSLIDSAQRFYVGLLVEDVVLASEDT